jgi:C4-dicarboxylate transporter, DctM subunit
MDPVVGYIGIGILMVFLFSGIPIGVAMGVTGIVGMLLGPGWDAALGMMQRLPYDTTANYAISVVPMFILMGEFCFAADISVDLYRAVYKWFGHMRGGLCMATIAACSGFAAVSGSSLATAATMGTVALPEMKKYGYSEALATGTVAAGGTIGILIPPSVIFLIYGIITENSIGKLFLAGFLPGILEAALYMLVIYLITLYDPKAGPRGPKSTFIEKIYAVQGVWVVLALFVIVIGGIYAGVFSPTEAAGIGAFGSFLFALVRRRLTWNKFVRALLESGKTSAMIFVIIIGANLLGVFMAVTRLPYAMADFVATLPIDRYLIFALIIVIYMLLGCLMDSMAMVLLTVPIFYPVILKLGFDPIWFGVMIVIVTELGLITPPVGLNVFVIKGVAPDVPIGTIFKGIWWFVMADIALVVIIAIFPQIALFLPNLLK